MERDGVGERLKAIQARIEAARDRSLRRQDVTLVAVSKTVQPAAIRAAYAAGQITFGENKVQEGTAKIAALRGEMLFAHWHFIGHLQTNKARLAAAHFSMIESVDSLRLAGKLAAEAVLLGKQLPILLEVNVAREPQKSGLDPAEVGDVAEQVRTMDGLDLQGLMTVAPQSDDAESVRWVFRELRDLRDALASEPGYETLRHLSMGMSSDFEVAVEEGATIVRVGRALFGERPTLERKTV